MKFYLSYLDREYYLTKNIPSFHYIGPSLNYLKHYWTQSSQEEIRSHYDKCYENPENWDVTGDVAYAFCDDLEIRLGMKRMDDFEYVEVEIK